MKKLLGFVDKVCNRLAKNKIVFPFFSGSKISTLILVYCKFTREQRLLDLVPPMPSRSLSLVHIHKPVETKFLKTY